MPTQLLPATADRDDWLAARRSGIGAISDDEPAHYWCCSDQTAICGADLTDADWVDDDDDTRDCSLCLYVLDEDLPCPVAGCAEAVK